jgi:hypothetical protein
MNRFDRTVRRLTEMSRREVLSLLAQFEAGEIDRREFEASVALVIAQNQVRAAKIADIGMAAMVSEQLKMLVSPLGLPADRVDQARMVRAVGTILAFDPKTVDLTVSRQLRFGRLAVAEPAAQLQDTMHRAMAGHGVTGWVRQTDSDPCPLCTELADGVVRSFRSKMSRHEGCVCIPRPARF